MRSRILNVTFDCKDAAFLARFWSGVTRWPASKQDMPGNPFWLVARSDHDGVRLVFVEVPETKTEKNRIHLDLVPVEGDPYGFAGRFRGRSIATRGQASRPRAAS